MKPVLAATLLLSPALLLAAPASAQDETGDTVNMVIVYGDDECPQAEDGSITVCARKAENERYRIPENLRFSESAENTAWTQRVESYEMVGDFGTMSCSPAGAGGFLGCTQQMIDAAFKDRSEASNVRFSQLIEAARAERLSSIDAEAAAEQERVEQIEREYMERLERERQGTLPGETVDPAPPVIASEAAPSANEDEAQGDGSEGEPAPE